MDFRRKKIIFYAIIFISVITMGIILAVVYNPEYSARIREPALTLKVGAYDNAPKVFQDEEGNWVGFFPDIVEYIAEQENWKIDWVAGSWDECLTRLESGEIDIMIDVAYDEARAAKYEFNQVAVFENWGVIYTGTGITVKSFKDLQDQDVAVMNSSIHYKGENGIYNLTQKFGITCNFVELASYQEVFGYIDDHPNAVGVVNRLYGIQYKKDYNVVETSLFFNPVDLKFAFPKAAELNVHLIERIDSHLIQMKEDPDSIYYQALSQYFLNEGERTFIPEWLLILLGVIIAMVVIFSVSSVVLKKQVDKRTQEIKEINQELEFLNNILLESIQDPVIVVEASGNTLLFNKSLKNLCSNLYHWDLLPQEPFFSRQNALTIGLGTLLNSPAEKNQITPEIDISNQLSLENGTYYTIMFSKLGRSSQNISSLEEERYFFFLHDITEFVELETLRKRFVSTVSHELRTPITSINLTLSNLVKYRTKLDETKINYMLDMLIKSGRVMADMIDDLLIASRIESGRMKLAPADLSIKHSIQEIINQLESNIQQKNINIDLKIPNEITIIGDPKRIMQVFRILVDNAVKYTPNNGKIEVLVTENDSLIKEILQDDGISISIKDSGIGIPERELPNLFNQFYRASNVGQIQGTGLGLVIAKELVELHNGIITVESRQNEGTTFRVYLPKKYIEKERKRE